MTNWPEVQVQAGQVWTANDKRNQGLAVWVRFLRDDEHGRTFVEAEVVAVASERSSRTLGYIRRIRMDNFVSRRSRGYTKVADSLSEWRDSCHA